MREDQALQLNVPDRIKVGYVKRQDTYTGQLAYVIYFDQKGVLRKEKSWETWRDKKLEPQEFANEPTEGFVLNKNGGGGRGGYSWNARNAFIRVYDPRNFEFEISVTNLLFILRETDCSRGKGLEGKFVYAWSGTELILLPAKSEDYKNSKTFTALQTQNVMVKELVPGLTYVTKRQEDLTFVGKYDYHFIYQPDGYRRKKDDAKDKKGVCKRYVFWDAKADKFVFLDDVKSLAMLKSKSKYPDFAELVTKYAQSEHGSKVTELFLKEVPDEAGFLVTYASEPWYYEEPAGTFVRVVTRCHYDKPTDITHIEKSAIFSLVEGVFIERRYSSGACALPPDKKVAVSNGWNRWDRDHYNGTWVEPTKMRLFARTESGAEFRVDKHSFTK